MNSVEPSFSRKDLVRLAAGFVVFCGSLFLLHRIDSRLWTEHSTHVSDLLARHLYPEHLGYKSWLWNERPADFWKLAACVGLVYAGACMMQRVLRVRFQNENARGMLALFPFATILSIWLVTH